MTVVYPIKSFSTSYLRNVTTMNLFAERDNYVEIIGQQFDKYSLSKFKSHKDPIGLYRHSNFPYVIHTNTRAYTEGFHPYRFQSKYPFSPKNTLFRNNIRFEDGTEITVNPATYNGNGQGSYPYIVMSKYNKDKKIETYRTFYSTNCVSPLIKITEESFMCISSSTMSSVDADSINNYFPNETYILASFSKFLNNYNDRGEYTNIVDKIELYNKKDFLNTKTVSLDGELLNIIGRSKNGNFIALLGKYKLDPNMKQSLQVISISPEAVITVLYDYTFTAGNASTVFCQPAISNDKKNIYLLNQSGTSSGNTFTEIVKIELDIENETCKPATKMTYDVGVYKHSHFSANYSYGLLNIPFYLYNMQFLKYGEKEYLVITPTFSAQELLNISKDPSGYSISYNLNYIKSNWDSFAKIYLYQVDNVNNTLILKDSIPQNMPKESPAKALFPINDGKGLVLTGKTSIDVYNVDLSSDKFIKTQSIPGPILSVGIDDLERLWYYKENGNGLEMFNTGTSINVSIDFESNNLEHDNTDLSNNVIVEAKNANNERVSLGLKLIIEGNAVFTENSLRTINVTTKTDMATKVPITIKGDGNINVYGSVIV